MQLLLTVRTQWLMGPGGVVGLNYLAVYPLLDRMHPSDADAWTEAFSDFRVLESAALAELRKAKT